MTPQEMYTMEYLLYHLRPYCNSDNEYINWFQNWKLGLGRAWTRPDPRPDPRVFWETRTRPAPFLEDPRQTRAKFLGPETHFSSQNPYLAQICMIFWGKYGPEVDPSKFFRTRDPTRAFLNGPRPDPSQKKETRSSPSNCYCNKLCSF